MLRPWLKAAPIVVFASLSVGCYPAFSPMPSRQVSPDITVPQVVALDKRLANCHDDVNARGEQAYNQRKSKYKLQRGIAALGVIGGGISTVVGKKDAKTAGGVIALLSSVVSVFLPGPEEDLESVQADARERDAAWGRVRGALEAAEFAARDLQTHEANKPKTEDPEYATKLAAWQTQEAVLRDAVTTQTKNVSNILSEQCKAR